MKLIKLNAIDSTNEYIKKIKDSIEDKEIVAVSYTHLTLPTNDQV